MSVLSPAPSLRATLRFRFKGERSYVHGTDMYTAVCDRLASRYPLCECSDFRLSFHNLSEEHCDLVVGEAADGISPPSTLVASLGFRHEGRDYRGWLSGTGDKVTERYAYPEERLVEHSVVDDRSITVTPLPRYTPIEHVVALTKRLHHRLLPELTADRSRSWVFSRLDSPAPLPDAPVGEIGVTLRARVGGRMTRSTIDIAGRSVGEICFNLLRR